MRTRPRLTREGTRAMRIMGGAHSHDRNRWFDYCVEVLIGIEKEPFLLHRVFGATTDFFHGQTASLERQTPDQAISHGRSRLR